MAEELKLIKLASSIHSLNNGIYKKVEDEEK